jgi:glutamyl-tRNA synthetase
MATPRVRFCPAPSGWLHVGGARTALYNWLHARGSGGAFVLRIEDTDADRATQESMDLMLEAMRWLGLEWDEGPGGTGRYGPYRQSERTPLYAAVAHELLRRGHAYDAYETAEELAAEREEAQRAGRPPGYGGGHRDLTEEQRDALLAEGRKPVIRVRTPDEGAIAFTDLVRGEVSFEWSSIPDFVILRADGTPTYQLANVVDDLAMGINLVARGEDLLSATPRQLLMCTLLDDASEGNTEPVLDRVLAEHSYPARPDDAVVPPAYAHLPLLVGEDRKPLSKRHGSVSIDEFRRQGYLPEVLLNFLALCGWSYDGQQERFTVGELTERFGFERVGRNPSYFDTDKLRSMNGDVIKDLGVGELATRLVPYFVEADLVTDPPVGEQARLIEAFAPLLQERMQILSEAPPLVAFAFRDEVTYDDAAVAKHLKGRAGEVLDHAAALLRDLDEWSGDAIEAGFRDLAADMELGLGKVMQPVRVAVSGSAVTPPLPQTLAVLDRDLVLARITAARPLVAGA